MYKLTLEKIEFILIWLSEMNITIDADELAGYVTLRFHILGEIDRWQS
jgi:hypothetical protein